MVLSDIGLMERSEIIDPAGQEVADFEAVFIVGEDRRAEVVAGDEDLRHDAEAFTHEDGRGDQRVADRRPVLASVHSGTVITSPGWPRCMFSL